MHFVGRRLPHNPFFLARTLPEKRYPGSYRSQTVIYNEISTFLAVMFNVLSRGPRAPHCTILRTSKSSPDIVTKFSFELFVVTSQATHL